MKLLRMVWTETVSLFVDDGFLALYALGLIALAGLLAEIAGLHGLSIGLLLLVGCSVILAESCIRGARKKQ